jgi:hypothetical protein
MHSPSGLIERPDLQTGICTIFEGDYHLGLAAFINSLVGAGYTGNIWAGFRGKLPPWIDQLTPVEGEAITYWVGSKIKLVFIPIETSLHLANYKPRFMLELFRSHARRYDYLWYFDPDILLRCKWTFFSNWQHYGIALCEEIISYHLSENDPLRRQWVDVGAQMGLEKPRLLDRYFNSGMLGVSPEHISVLQLWMEILDQIGRLGVDLKELQPGNREAPFHAVDQDALNMAVMYVEHTLSTMGPEAMGFIFGGFTMYHAVGAKPWRASFLRRAIAAVPPTAAEKFFFRQVSWPIRAYSPLHVHAKRLACAVAAFIGRFYHRS